MTGTFLKVLMAASALVPVAATAQRLGADVGVNVDARGERGGRWGGREDRAERPQPDAARQDRPRADIATAAQARGGARFEGRGDRPQVDGQRGGDRRDYRGNDGAAFQRGTREAPQQFDQTPRDDRQAYGRDRQDDRRAYQGDRRDDGRRFQGGEQYRGYGTVQGNRSGYDNRWDNRGNSRWDNRRDDRGSRWGNGGGQWNRGWRSDNRYAWSDYRASNRGAYRLPRYYAPSGWGSGYRRFGVGFTLSSVLFNQNYWIQDPYSYRLPEAYGPYRWVRYYNDALLVDLDSGRVVDTVYDIFW